ncbi:MAG TPA: DMT family transporter, partial [Quisquiliibacterium sp.]|nr:DMT family transporter [Quisquiliibacterium sp.]
MNPPPATGLMLALFTVVLWGAQLPIAKAAMADIDGYTVSLVRYGVAGLGFLLVLLWREGPGSLSMGGRGVLVAASGALGMAGSALLVFVGLALTTPEVAVIIIALQPAMAALAEWLLRGRRPEPFTLACLVVAFLGVVVVVTRGEFGLGELARSAPRELLGNLLVLLGAMAWVGYTMTTDRFGGWSSLRVASLTSLAALAGTALVWVIALSMGAAQVPEAATLERHGWRLA